jgi:hypothetical protein
LTPKGDFKKYNRNSSARAVKERRKTKSLYLVVNEEKISPNPKAKQAIKKIRKGVAKTQILG